MARHRGGSPIKARYRGGVPVKKVMRGTVEVWRAIIPVTPQAPTFLTASPWVVLPSQPGVTYSVAGAPGHLAMVTVTATAQAGYELVGTRTWTHTFPSRYPVTLSYPSIQLGLNYTVLETHTVTESGNFNVRMVGQRISGTFSGSVGLRAIGPWGTSSDTGTLSVWRDLSAGQTIQFLATAPGALNSVRFTVDCTISR